MSARPFQQLSNAIIQHFTVKAASAVTEGMPVTLDSEGVVLDSTAGQNAVGVALHSAAAGEDVQVAMANAIVSVKVGTAGATVGGYAVVGTTGAIDKTFGGGTTVGYCLGKFLQTGVSGDKVALLIGMAPSVTA